MKVLLFVLAVAVYGTPNPTLQRLRVFSSCVKKSMTESQRASGVPLRDETRRCLNGKLFEYIRQGGNIVNAIQESITLVKNANVGEKYFDNHMNEVENHAVRSIGTPNPDIMLTDRYMEEEEKKRKNAIPGLGRYFTNAMRRPIASPSLDLEFVSFQLLLQANGQNFESLADTLRIYELIGVPVDNIQYVFYRTWNFIKNNEIPQINEQELKHLFRHHLHHASIWPTGTYIESQLRPFFTERPNVGPSRLDSLADELKQDTMNGNLDRVQDILDACMYLQVPRTNIVALFQGVYNALKDSEIYFD